MCDLGLLVLDGSKEFGEKVNSYLAKWRGNQTGFILESSCPRFGSGEAKGVLKETIRDKDIYILVDVMNHSISYNYFGKEHFMSPDEHYQDLKRLIAACSGKAKRITVIMPFLYESRQHKRSSRESLDCAMMLQELVNMGVYDIITVDAHDPRMKNSIPFNGMENIYPSLQFVEALIKNIPDLTIDKENLMIISPDEGATDRASFLANVLKVNMGMFYKRRDYSIIVNGKNPIVSHEFLGENVEGKDIIIIDDMISSGDSMIDVAKQIKQRGAKRIFVLATFGLFTDGLSRFDESVEKGYIDKVLTTNCIYQTPELLTKHWYVSVEMESYIAAIIDTLHNEKSISSLITPTDRIRKLIENIKNN